MLTAAALMQRTVLTIPAMMPATEVMHLFVTAGVSGAPVVDEHGAVVGMIAAGDLLREVDQAHDDDRDDGEAGSPGDHLRTLTAQELASPGATWVAPDLAAHAVAAVMQRERVQHVLVGTDGVLAGILTAFDLLRAILPT